MKIDYYTLHDPTDPNAWSGTYYELIAILEKLGRFQGAYNVRPPGLTSIKPEDKTGEKIAFVLKNLKYFKYHNGKIYLASEYHPHVVETSRKMALEIYNTHPSPDAILTHGDYAVFDKTPFFIFHDLDMGTLLDWRLKGMSTYMCDPVSTSILKRRFQQQKVAYDKARAILVASDWIGRNIKSYIREPEKVYRVGMGHRYEPIDLDTSILERRFESPKLLFIGKDGVRKGLDITLSAFETVQQEIPESRLEVITDYHLSPKQIIRRMERNKGVHASMGIPYEVLKNLYLDSSIFVMPTRFDAWGKVFFEAMAFGLPVIGARNCAMPEFIRDGYNGYTTDYNPDEIADRIVAIFSSFEKYKAMSENAIKVSKEYTWDNIVKNLVDVIDRNIA
jgi:glycosyltransferase involved in cell wall biosynthesis